jgi:SAM-dependent methyltransferase
MSKEIGMTEQEMHEKIKGYGFYHTIRLTPGLETAGWEAVRPLTKLICRCIRAVDLKGKRVLDIGCRDGLMSYEAERAGAAEVIGIDSDLSRAAVEFLIPALQSKVRMQQMNLLDLRPETFGTFDVIIFPGVLYHLRYPFWALKLIRDVLKPGGHLILETAIWAGASKHAVLYCPTGKDSPYEPTSCTFFNQKGMVDTLNSLGFAPEKINSLNAATQDQPKMDRAALILFSRWVKDLAKRTLKVGTQPPPIPLTNSTIDRVVFTSKYDPAIIDNEVARYWDATHEMHARGHGAICPQPNLQAKSA